MEFENRDEAQTRQREEALARRLGQALDQIAPRGDAPCPDAELLAAYHERALEASEAAQCEDHIASCSRCRNILAVLAASADTPLAEKEVAHLGELIAARAQRHEDSNPSPVRSSLWDWRMRWLAPALGLAAVLAMWFAIKPPWRTADQNASGTLIAQAPKSEAPSVAGQPPMDSPSRVEPKNRSEQDPTSRQDRAPAKSLPSNAPPEIPSTGRLKESDRREATARDEFAANSAIANKDLENEKKQKSEAAGASVAELAAPSPQTPAPAAPPVPAPSLQAEVQGAAGAGSPESAAVANAPARAMAAPAARAKASNKAAAANEQISTFSAQSVAGIASLLKSPSGSASWRIGRNGLIERSTDAGKNWLPQVSPSQEDWLAGAASSDTVAWIVGRNGAIARTTDGEHWERIQSPAQNNNVAGKLPDWTAITVSDAQTATITSTDQRRYATRDGGKTWELQ